MSTGLRTAADVGRKRDNRTWMPAESVVISSPPAWQASATKNAGTAAVRHDRDAIATRDRLRRDAPRDVEQLVDGVGPDHAGLLEQRIHGHVGGGQHRAGVRSLERRLLNGRS